MNWNRLMYSTTLFRSASNACFIFSNCTSVLSHQLVHEGVDFLPSLLIQTLVRLLLRQSYGALSGIVELEAHRRYRTFSCTTTIHP